MMNISFILDPIKLCKVPLKSFKPKPLFSHLANYSFAPISIDFTYLVAYLLIFLYLSVQINYRIFDLILLYIFGLSCFRLIKFKRRTYLVYSN